MKYLFIIIFLLFSVISVSAQNNCAADPQGCEAKLTRASQQIDKLLDVKTSLEDENTKLRIETAVARAVKTADEEVKKAQAETIKVLREIKCNETKTTFFFIWKKRTKQCF